MPKYSSANLDNEKKVLIGEQLIRVRELKGKKQVEVSRDINISRKRLCSYETDRAFPPIEILVKLSKYYNISLDYLIFDDNFSDEMKNKIKDKEIYELAYMIDNIGDKGKYILKDFISYFIEARKKLLNEKIN